MTINQRSKILAETQADASKSQVRDALRSENLIEKLPSLKGQAVSTSTRENVRSAVCEKQHTHALATK